MKFATIKLSLALFLIVNVTAICDSAYRSFDGTCNNVNNPNWGKSGLYLELPEGHQTYPNWPNARRVSNTFLATKDSKLDKDFTLAERIEGLSADRFGRNNLFVMLGQFVAHDISQNPLTFNPANVASNYQVQIEDPTDPLYQPTINNKTGIFTLPSNGAVVDGIFRTLNLATSYMDASTVYGSNPTVANTLRTFQGGRLKDDGFGNLPFSNDTPVPNECGQFRAGSSAAGDLRPDENAILHSVHTLFFKEHNYLAAQIQAANPSMSDEEIYQKARALNIAEYQHVIYEEWLPTMFGQGAVNRALGRYRGYDNTVDASASASFTTSAFRVIHDLVGLPILILDDQCNLIKGTLTTGVPDQESINCEATFFRAVGINDILRGAIAQKAQAQDARIVNGMRNVYTRSTTAGGNIDIETANIFRGREHGVVNYDALRKYWLGKSVYEERLCQTQNDAEDSLACFRYVTMNETLARDLKNTYQKVNRIDPYVGLLVEDKGNSLLPPTASSIILDQFKRLRDGDRFYYENSLSREDLRWVNRQRFADILRRHTNLEFRGNDAFEVQKFNHMGCPKH